MAIPGYQDFMLPILRVASNGEANSVTDTMNQLAKRMGIGEADRDELLPSGTQTRFYNPVTWAITYLSNPPTANYALGFVPFL